MAFSSWRLQENLSGMTWCHSFKATTRMEEIFWSGSRLFYHWRWSWVWLRWWFEGEDQNADQWWSQESKWRRLGWVRTTKTWSLRRNKVSWEELKSWWLSSSPSSLSSLSIQKASLFLGVNSSFTEECHYHHCFCPPGGLTGCWSTPPYSHHPQVIWQDHHHYHYYHCPFTVSQGRSLW